MMVVRSLFCAVLAVVVSAAVPVLAQATDFATDTSSLTVKIIGSDGKPAAGVRLLAYHLSSERLYTSDPTKKNGECRLEGLPYGYHDLAVETPDGLFVSSQVINIPPASKASVVLTLLPDSPGAGPRSFTGSEADAVGEAHLDERLRGRAFWKSPRGIAILGGAGGAVLLLLALSGGDSSETPVSPVSLTD